jgi:hypothetical protein
MHFLQLPHWTWDIVVQSVCAAALWQGSRSERIGAVIILGGWLGGVIVSRPGWWNSASGVVAIDAMALVGFVWLALRSPRYWPLWAAGFHLLAVVTHIARIIDPHVRPWAYVTAGILWGYLLVVALAVGVIGAWRERMRWRKAAEELGGPAVQNSPGLP